MTHSSHTRWIALMAVMGCAILSAWATPALGRPIDDPALPTAPAAVSSADPSPAESTADAGTASPDKQTDWTLAIGLAGGAVLVTIATAGYAHRARVSRRTLA